VQRNANALVLETIPENMHRNKSKHLEWQPFVFTYTFKRLSSQK